MLMLSTFLHFPITRGAIGGIVTAAAVDLHAFASWKKFNDLATYDWSTATFRWLQGAVLGGLTAAGFAITS